MNKKTSIGIIGCGNISSIYLQAPRLFDILQVVACADIDMKRAISQADRYGIPKACAVEELLADPDIETRENCAYGTAREFHNSSDVRRCIHRDLHPKFRFASHGAFRKGGLNRCRYT